MEPSDWLISALPNLLIFCPFDLFDSFENIESLTDFRLQLNIQGHNSSKRFFRKIWIQIQIQNQNSLISPCLIDFLGMEKKFGQVAGIGASGVSRRKFRSLCNAMKVFAIPKVFDLNICGFGNFISSLFLKQTP